jgi:pimeloyl-ACP methyl ester carboxylesterase
MEAIAHTLLYDAAIMRDGSLPTERLASVKTPTLVIAGGASPEWARHAVEALVDNLSNARAAVLEGQTHAVDPAALAPVLETFFAN